MNFPLEKLRAISPLAFIPATHLCILRRVLIPASRSKSAQQHKCTQVCSKLKPCKLQECKNYSHFVVEQKSGLQAAPRLYTKCTPLCTKNAQSGTLAFFALSAPDQRLHQDCTCRGLRVSFESLDYPVEVAPRSHPSLLPLATWLLCCHTQVSRKAVSSRHLRTVLFVLRLSSRLGAG